MRNLIQTNKFTEFCDEENIFFSKIDLIDSTIEEIKFKKNSCVLIVGNGDLPFTNEIDKKIPNNVIKIFAQNDISSSERVESLPLGIGNSDPCKKSGHGDHWDDVKEKVEILNLVKKIEPENFKIYCNFRDYTNPNHRSSIKQICNELDYVKVDENDLTYNEFISNILESTCNICPAGNGVDTHRLWETLYCYRIPVTFRVNNTRSYYWNDNGKIGIYDNLYKKLPIVVLDNENDLKNKNLMVKKIEEANNKWSNLNLLDFNYWENKISLITGINGQDDDEFSIFKKIN